MVVLSLTRVTAGSESLAHATDVQS